MHAATHLHTLIRPPRTGHARGAVRQRPVRHQRALRPAQHRHQPHLLYVAIPVLLSPPFVASLMDRVLAGGDWAGLPQFFNTLGGCPGTCDGEHSSSRLHCPGLSADCHAAQTLSTTTQQRSQTRSGISRVFTCTNRCIHNRLSYIMIGLATRTWECMRARFSLCVSCTPVERAGVTSICRRRFLHHRRWSGRCVSVLYHTL